MSAGESEYPGYEAVLPWHHRQPFDGVEQFPCVIAPGDASYFSWAPEPGNSMATWVHVGTRRLNQGTFYVEPGHWFDAGNHPNPEPYYVLRGSLMLSNPDTSDVVELQGGRCGEHPGSGVPPRLERRRRGLRDPLVGARRDAHRRVQARDLDEGARRVAVVRPQGRDAQRRPTIATRASRRTSTTWRRWPPRASTKGRVDMQHLPRSRWLHLLHGHGPEADRARLVLLLRRADPLRQGHACPQGASRRRSRAPGRRRSTSRRARSRST